MQKDPSRYRAYLLRLWQVDDGMRTTWRASLQDVRSGQRLGFASLDEAMAHVRREIFAAPDVERVEEDDRECDGKEEWLDMVENGEPPKGDLALGSYWLAESGYPEGGMSDE